METKPHCSAANTRCLISLILILMCVSCGGSPEIDDAKNSYFERHIAEDPIGHLSQQVVPSCVQEVDAVEKAGPVDGEEDPQPEQPIVLEASQEAAAPSGPCDAGQTKKIIRKDNHDFAEQMYSCVVQDTWNFTANLDLHCLRQKYPDVDYGCLTCFEKFTKCAADNCKGDCAPTWLRGYGDRSVECKKCTWFFCGDEMQSCGGVPLSRLPDFKR